MNKNIKKFKKRPDFVEIYGFHSVQAALKNNRRNHYNLIISKQNLEKFDQNLIKKVHNVSCLSTKEINKIYKNNESHQGIILRTSKLNQPSLESFLDDAISEKEVIVILDHVSDPSNIGNIMRSCALFGCSAIIVSKDRSPDITSAIAKSASGALEVVKYIQVINISRAIRKLKEKNFWVIGLENNNNNLNSKEKFKLPKKCVLVLGSESKGLRNLTKKECDLIKAIPININYQYGIDSLNVSNACSIALFYHFYKS